MQHRFIGLNDKNKDIIAFTNFSSTGTNCEDRNRMKQILSQAIVSELTMRQRECIMMYFYDNKKMKDIATELSLSPSTVTRHIKAGLNNLKSIAKYY